MNSHLTHEELTDKLMGVSSLTVNAHLLECSSCAAEMEKVRTSIASFQGAAQSWSESGGVRARFVSEGRNRNLTSWPAGWILVAAAIILFVAGSTAYLYQQRHADQTHSAQISTPVAAPALSQSQLDKDNQLLSEVSGELGESVPAPMQPLVPTSSSSNRVVNK